MGPSANQRAVRWLRAELPALVASGTISAENAQAIERYYEARSTGSSKIGFVLLAAVGSILIAAGIVLLIAHNWDDFSRPVRSAIAFLPLIAAQALSVFVLLRRGELKAWRECAAIFNVAAIGTAISLVSQTYQITGTLANFIFVWMLLSIPLVYLLRTTLGAITYVIGAVVWLSVRLGTRELDPTYFWLLLVLVVPYFATVYRRNRGSGETTGLVLVLAIAAAIGLGYTAYFSKANLGVLAFAGFFAATYICGIEFFPTANSGRLPLLALLAGIAIGVMTIVLTFEDIWRLREAPVWPIDFPHTLSVAIELSFPIVAVALAVWSFARRKVQFSVLAAAFPVVAGLGWYLSGLCERSSGGLWSSKTECDLWAAILLDVYALVLGVELIARGLRANSAARTNFGLLVIAALGIARFFDSDLSFVTRAIGFIAIGVGFILTNVVLFKKRSAA
jgi:uncharacterized membrane protein